LGKQKVEENSKVGNNLKSNSKMTRFAENILGRSSE
jgi:hypothetical protein